MKKWLPVFLLISTMLVWAANFHFTKIALLYYSTLGIATWRFFLSAVALVALLYSKYKTGLFKIKLNAKEWGYTFLTGFLGIFLTIYFFNKGLETTSAVNGSLIIATTPAITGVLSYIFEKQRLKIFQWLAILLSFSGVVLIIIKGDLSSLFEFQFVLGDFYILGMALVFSLSQIVIAKYLAHLDAILVTTLSILFGLACFAMVSFSEMLTAPLPQNPEFWVSILFLGFLGSAAAYVAFYYCVAKIGSTSSSLYMNLIPFFAVLLAFPFGEKIYGIQLIGGSLIIAGLLGYRFAKNS